MSAGPIQRRNRLIAVGDLGRPVSDDDATVPGRFLVLLVGNLSFTAKFGATFGVEYLKLGESNMIRSLYHVGCDSANSLASEPEKPLSAERHVSKKEGMGSVSQTRRDLSRLEDYLEAIYRLSREKGYISTVELSESLGVRPPTVSNMVVKLAKSGYLVHQRYRGMTLTESGTKVARSVVRRHQTIEEFLLILGVPKKIAYEDAEGIEHHVHPATFQRLEGLVRFLSNNPKSLEALAKELQK